jgi:cysteinyl-tRNA synthetase
MQLYNTSTKKIEHIQPQTHTQVTIYTCGPTVYDYPHIGNWFTFIRYDLLIRTLRLAGLKTNWIMNITDVGHLVSDADDGEDKLEKGARREGKTAWDIAAFYSGYFEQGMERLAMLHPNGMPKATDHIPEQIVLIQKLEANGLTYVIDDGVYYDTSKFPTYTKFAELDLADQQASGRVAVNKQKRNQSDFALWKFSAKNQQRDMEWGSPWGVGFPGWHLECSAMAMKYLGKTIDIHAGGIDHIPVHHTNEIAQSEGATRQTFSNYWMHTNHITIEGEKISKSLGNTITLEDIEAKGFSLQAFRLYVLESHYRTQSKFSWDNLAAAQNRLKNYQNFADMRFQLKDSGNTLPENYFGLQEKNITNILTNDLHTPAALSAINEVVDYVGSHGLSSNPEVERGLHAFINFLDRALGIHLASSQDISDEQKLTISNRLQARTDKDWTKSDELRDQLAAQGIGLRDTGNETIWYRL